MTEGHVIYFQAEYKFYTIPEVRPFNGAVGTDFDENRLNYY